MKQLIGYSILILILSISAVSCAVLPGQTGGPRESKWCPPPEGTKSFICTKSAEAGVVPEQVYGWIFSATAIAAVTDVADITWICEFKKKVDARYLRLYPLSYDSAIAEIIAELKVVKDPRKVLLINSILNQNLSLYASPDLVDAYDDLMLRAGSVKFDKDMMCTQ